MQVGILEADVGLRRTGAYYRTSARAMCVRKGFGECVRCRCVWAILDLQFAIAFFAH